MLKIIRAFQEQKEGISKKN